MTKKFVSVLLALCMLFTLAPMAMAANQPETIIRPDGVEVEIPTFAPTIQPMSVTEDIIEIDTADEFVNQNWLNGGNYKLTADINLSDASDDISEWQGIIYGFYAHLDGDGHTIYGVGENKYLIDAYVGGTIENLVFDVGESAAFLVFAPANMAGANYDLTMRNVSVTGDVYLLSADQSNYSPFIYASHGNFTMESCKNYADISGITYASVFYGYSPYNGGSVKFVNCENHGNVNLAYAALFFGNPTYLSDANVAALDTSIEITECHNYGTIRSINTAPHYFVTDVGGGLSNYSQCMENQLIADNNTSLILGGTCADPNCSNNHDGSVHDGKLYYGVEAEGLKLTMNEDKSLVVTRATNEEEAEIAYYEVIVSSYVSVYDQSDPKNLVFMGTEQRSVSEILDSYDEENTITSNVKYYGFADQGAGTSAGTVADTSVVTVDNENYYVIEDKSSITYPGTQYIVVASANSVPKGEFVPNVAAPQKAVVNAYDENDLLVASAYLGGE